VCLCLWIRLHWSAVISMSWRRYRFINSFTGVAATSCNRFSIDNRTRIRNCIHICDLDFCNIVVTTSRSGNNLNIINMRRFLFHPLG